MELVIQLILYFGARLAQRIQAFVPAVELLSFYAVQLAVGYCVDDFSQVRGVGAEQSDLHLVALAVAPDIQAVLQPIDRGFGTFSRSLPHPRLKLPDSIDEHVIFRNRVHLFLDVRIVGVFLFLIGDQGGVEVGRHVDDASGFELSTMPNRQRYPQTQRQESD